MIDIPTAATETTEAPAKEEAVTTEARKPVIDKQGRSYGTGRRKDSSARVWIKPGSGKVTINDKDISVYFGRDVLKMIINQPFEITETSGKFDVFCRVSGGGLSGQAGAVRHGISRALANYDPENFHKPLRKNSFLTRDSRVVERKKYGKRKARRSFQFSKR